eukprot:scaffold30365_cov23-Tisochrysis_lutea.AAC.1
MKQTCASTQPRSRPGSLKAVQSQVGHWNRGVDFQIAAHSYVRHFQTVQKHSEKHKGDRTFLLTGASEDIFSREGPALGWH